MDQGRTQTVPQEGAQPQQSHRSVGLGADPVEADAGVVVTLGHDGPGDGGDERCHRGSRGLLHVGGEVEGPAGSAGRGHGGTAAVRHRGLAPYPGYAGWWPGLGRGAGEAISGDVVRADPQEVFI